MKLRLIPFPPTGLPFPCGFSEMWYGPLLSPQ